MSDCRRCCRICCLESCEDKKCGGDEDRLDMYWLSAADLEVEHQRTRDKMQEDGFRKHGTGLMALSCHDVSRQW